MKDFNLFLEAAHEVNRVVSGKFTSVRYSDGSQYVFDNRGKSHEWNDSEGKLHRVDGPANIYVGVFEEWYQHGVLHRTDGPAAIYFDSRTISYWVNGKQLSRKEYLKHFSDNSKYKHWRAESPDWVIDEAVEVSRKKEGNHTVIRYSDGNYCVIYKLDHIEMWYDRNKKLHRVNSPAVYSKVRDVEEWYYHGKLHRTDGPAIIHREVKAVRYYVNNKYVSRSDFLKHFDDNTEFKDWDDIGLEIEPAP